MLREIEIESKISEEESNLDHLMLQQNSKCQKNKKV